MGAAIMVVVLVIAIPVVVMMSGAVIAGVLGWFVKDDVDDGFAGTEDLELSRR